MVISDPKFAKHILSQNAKGYSKGLLAEILDFIMGTGLIPADGEVWKVRRRALVPAIHKRVRHRVFRAERRGESVEQIVKVSIIEISYILGGKGSFERLCNLRERCAQVK